MKIMSLKIAVLYGSTRENRQGIKAAKFVVNELVDSGHSPTLVDVLDYDIPFLNKMHKEFTPGDAPAWMETISKIFDDADAFVIVSGEYNHSIPPALKNLMDHFQKEYQFKPSGIACYSAGPFGGVRVAMHLRAVLCELGMPSIPVIFPISAVHKAFDDDGNAADETYPKRIKRFIDELAWYGEALKKQRIGGVPY
jgi:NAD(P)H-dependent FMN reductase